MGKSLAFGVLMFVVVLLCTGISHGDVTSSVTHAPSLPAASAPAEPISGTAVMPNPGDETIMKDPFALYSAGPPGTVTWSYKQLTSVEQAWADKNADSSNWDAKYAGFARAAQERARQAAADAAAHQLGITDNLGATGVIP